MRFRQLAALTLAANVLSAVVAVLIALGGFGVWALVGRQLVLFGMLAVLSALFGLRALHAHGSSDGPVVRADTNRGGERWFFIYALAYVLSGNLPYFVIGSSGDAALVGLYSMACTIAYAPTLVSGQVGKVLFAATASRPDICAERTEQSVQLMSILMLPLLPVGVLVAPTILPAAFGAEWMPMVAAFQILLVAGIGQTVIDGIAEPITGTGHMSFRAKAMVAQCAASIVALLILVPIAGIRGAALVQLLMFIPLAVLLFTAGARRAGTSPRALWGRLRPVAAALSLQLVVTFGVLVGLIAFGATDSVSACVAAVIGLTASVPLLVRALIRIRS
jgi:O-antigen/teichoic acid export membrane protein